MHHTASRFFCLVINVVIMMLIFSFHSSLIWSLICAILCIMIADKADCLIHTKYQYDKFFILTVSGTFLFIIILLGNHGFRHLITTYLIFILLYFLTCRRSDYNIK